MPVLGKCEQCDREFSREPSKAGRYCSRSCAMRGRDHSNRTQAPVADRFQAHIVPDPISGCWQWTGAVSRAGYGRFWLTGATDAYRAAWQIFRGEIPAGLTLDHLCRNRRCVNPEHLEPVPGPVNILRGNGPTAVNARKTHCKRGHPFDAENTGITSNGRRCRRCGIDREAAKRANVKRIAAASCNVGKP